MCGSLCRARQLRPRPLNTNGDDMKTLITDDFAERPQQPLVIQNGATLATGTLNVGMTVIVTTGGYVAGDPPPPRRVQAWVGKPVEEITDGTER